MKPRKRSVAGAAGIASLAGMAATGVAMAGPAQAATGCLDYFSGIRYDGNQAAVDPGTSPTALEFSAYSVHNNCSSNVNLYDSNLNLKAEIAPGQSSPQINDGSWYATISLNHNEIVLTS